MIVLYKAEVSSESIKSDTGYISRERYYDTLDKAIDFVVDEVWENTEEYNWKITKMFEYDCNVIFERLEIKRREKCKQ